MGANIYTIGEQIMIMQHHARIHVFDVLGVYTRNLDATYFGPAGEQPKATCIANFIWGLRVGTGAPNIASNYAPGMLLAPEDNINLNRLY